MTNSEQSESLNVLMLTEDFYPKESGGAFIDWNVAKYLVEAGDSVTVVTPRHAETATQETVEGVEIRRPFRGHDSDDHPNSLPGIFRRVLFVALVIPYLVRLYWRREFDLVYSTNHLLHFPATLVTILFRSSHVSFVGFSPSIRDDVSFWNLFVLLERLNFRFFMGDRVLCRTPSIHELISKTCDVEVVRLDGIVDREAIESAVSSTRSAVSTDSKSGIQLIFAGRLVDIKNPTELPDIISQLPPEYSLYIVGDGPERETVEAAIKQAGVDDRVRLKGRLSHEETLQLINTSDLLLLPSEADAYPTVVFEALSLGTPVLATPVGVLPSIQHQNLTVTRLENFVNIIHTMILGTGKPIDDETLEDFAVDRFAEDVRKQLLMESEL